MSTDTHDGPHMQQELQMSRKRRPSYMMQQDTAGPVIRRMSRLEPRASISRRMSYASRSSFSSLLGLGQHKCPVKVANSYRLGPCPEEKFNSAAAGKMMTGVLQSYLEGEKYDKMLSVSLSKNLAEVIKERMKDQGFSQRYKYVCVVTLGENKDQGMAVCSRCIWNTETDNYASASYTKGNLFAVATLYALYFE